MDDCYLLLLLIIILTQHLQLLLHLPLLLEHLETVSYMY